MKEFGRIVQLVQTQVGKDDRVLELYGGVGTIGLHLLSKEIASLECSDSNPHNKVCFEKSLANLAKTPGSEKVAGKAHYTQLGAKEMVEAGKLRDRDVIVVDPPRKGLEPEVLQALCAPKSGAHSAKRIVYVSCGWKAFKRDFEELTKNGWSLGTARGFILFPGADHIETCAVFNREG